MHNRSRQMPVGLPPRATPPSSYPGEQAINDDAGTRCEEIIADYTSRATLELVTGAYFIYPRASEWRRGDRTVTCMAVTDPGHTSSLKG